jgi:hypothetical protein
MWTKEKICMDRKSGRSISENKETLAQDAMLTHLQFDKPFIVHTDTSGKQIRGVVTQEEKPLGFFFAKS